MSQLQPPLNHWFSETTRMSFQVLESGFSGASVFKVIDGDRGQTYGLKAWPIGTLLRRVEQIHRVVDVAAQSSTLLTAAIPDRYDGVTCVVSQDRCWDLRRWIQGSPLPIHASGAALEKAGEAIATIHSALHAVPQDWAAPRMPEQRSSSGRSALDRIERIEVIGRDFHPLTWPAPDPQELTRQFPDPSDLASLATVLIRVKQMVLENWGKITSVIAPSLRILIHEAKRDPSTWILRDLRREHVLCEDGEVRGVIDYDALRWDWPAIDLARFSGGFLKAGRPSALEDAVAGYRRIRPLNDRQCCLAAMLVLANDWVNVANWYVWLVVQRRTFTNPPRVVTERLNELITSLSHRISN